MSDDAEFSVWSNDGIELLENIDKEINLVNSSSESGSIHVNETNGESWKVFQENEPERNKEVLPRQKEINNSHSDGYRNQNNNNNNNDNLHKLKFHFSSNDLTRIVQENISLSDEVPNKIKSFSHSISCNSLSNNEKDQQTKKNYDHIESRIKQYFNEGQSQQRTLEGRKMLNDGEKYEDLTKEQYLEEINMRLRKELEEKTALLNNLQEKYENLLLKYAEAQNKIDQLRVKTGCASTEYQNQPGFQQNLMKTNHQMAVNAFLSSKGQQESWQDVKCQKAIVAPFIKDDYQNARTKKIDRPTSLPLEPKIFERDTVKAGTPTDSEGVSSVITSMSGHSKILNTLDVHSPNMNYMERDFVLNDNEAVKDAFDKVKNWQNSLPPLELIETPETTLYDQSPMKVSPTGNYRQFKEDNIQEEEDEEVEEEEEEGDIVFNTTQNSKPLFKYEDETPQAGFKDYLPMLPMPVTIRKGANQRNEFFPPERALVTNENAQNIIPVDDIPSSCIIQRRKKPPLLRCSSLPTYEYDTPKSSNRNIYIPPLDLENMTISDVESSQLEYDDFSKGNRVSSSSYITSQSGSMEFSQTYRTINNSIMRTDYSESPYSMGPSFNKSISITPERCNDLPSDLCAVCGEKVSEQESPFPLRSNSYQNFREIKDTAGRSTERRGKYPFNRSVSFSSETHRKCYHTQENCSLHRRSKDSLENFDIYTNNLKARSQVVMKALAAHVNNT